MEFDYQARMQTLLTRTGSDVVALVPGPNMVYFTGLHFHLSERPTIAFISEQGLSFIIPELEAIKLKQRPELEAQEFMWRDADGYQDAFCEAVNRLGLNKGASFSVDGQTMRVFEWLGFGHCGVNVQDVQDMGTTLLDIRAIKTPQEIEAMRAAVQISETALQRTLDWVEIGMTEQEIARKLDAEMNALGSDGNSFSSLVLTGEKSALPHGSTGTRQLGEHDFLLIDFGATKQGYPADITRTFCPGTPTDTMVKMYDAVKRANEAARAFARPNVTCHEVDQVARAVIEEAGFGAYFTHRLGHGLGLAVHELPNIAQNNHVPLLEGMVFTIEPGIYIPDLGGVRIEDNVVVTADGIESLTSYPRDL